MKYQLAKTRNKLKQKMLAEILLVYFTTFFLNYKLFPFCALQHLFYYYFPSCAFCHIFILFIISLQCIPALLLLIMSPIVQFTTSPPPKKKTAVIHSTLDTLSSTLNSFSISHFLKDVSNLPIA